MADEDAGSGAREGITAEWLASLPAMADVASTMPWAKFEEAAEALRSIFSSREAVLDASPAAINFCGFDSRLTSRLTEKERGPPPGTPARRLYDAMLEALNTGTAEPVREALANMEAETKRAAINTRIKATTILGHVASGGGNATDLEILRLMLEERGDPNFPEDNPPASYPISATHSIPVLRLLVEHGAKLDTPHIEDLFRRGHPFASPAGAKMRRYLRDELGIDVGRHAADE